MTQRCGKKGQGSAPCMMLTRPSFQHFTKFPLIKPIPCLFSPPPSRLDTPPLPSPPHTHTHTHAHTFQPYHQEIDATDLPYIGDGSVGPMLSGKMSSTRVAMGSLFLTARLKKPAWWQSCRATWSCCRFI